jgi:hypothetical protein
MNNELERLWNESLVAYFDIISPFVFEMVLYHWLMGAKCVMEAWWPCLLRVH